MGTMTTEETATTLDKFKINTNLPETWKGQEEWKIQGENWRNNKEISYEKEITKYCIESWESDEVSEGWLQEEMVWIE